MSNQPQPQPESSELLGDWHPLVQQLGSSEGLVSFSTVSHSLQLNHVTDQASLRQFLEAYQTHVLVPYELPTIQRAFRHAARNETRELVAFDNEIASETILAPFASASQRVGQCQLKRLRPLRDVRLVQRYLRAVDQRQAHGWHTLVYGVTLAIYSLPILQGLASYERQTLMGFIHAVAPCLRMSEQDCRILLEDLSPCLPRMADLTLGEDDQDSPRRPKISF